jgi:hypothetical protein
MTTETTFQPLTGADDPRVLAFLRAWHENMRPGFVRDYPNLSPHYDGPHYAKTAKAGRKYINLDHGGSGMLMVERDTGNVYGIKGYGTVHRGHPRGHIEALTAELERATAASRPMELRP